MDDISAVTSLLAKTTVEQKLEEVSFAGQGLKLDKAEDAGVIVKAIEESSQVHSLILNGNTLGVEAAKTIAEALKKRPEFQRAKWFDLFTGRLRSEIPPALKSLGAAIMEAGAHLVELDLSDNAFGPDGVKAVKDLLESKSCYSIKELRFNNNGLGIGGKILAESLIKCHQESSKAGKPLALKVFIAGRNRLENPGATALAQAFKTIGTLEEIAMPQNGINPEGIRALAGAVESSPNLRILNLNDNTFTSEGAIAMAKSLRKSDKLEVLNFGDCLIRSEGASALADTIKSGLPSLKEVNFAFGEIKMEAGIKVVQCLENKKNLEKVDLNGNAFGDEGVERIKGSLDAFGKLDVLQSLSDDEGSDAGEEDDYDDDEDDDDNDDNEGEERDDPELQIRGQAITPSPRKDTDKEKENIIPCTAAEFLSFPSSEKFLGLGDNRDEKLLEYLGNKGTDEHEVVSVLVKIASITDSKQPTLKAAAQQTFDALLDKLLKSGDCQPTTFANEILVYLGYLKSESKVRPVNNPTGLLLSLEYILQQEYFPKSIVPIFTTFLSRPNENVDKCFAAKHQLNSVLFTM